MAFHNRVRSMFLRRVELRKARPLNARLSIVATCGNLRLLHVIVHDPHLRSVLVGSVANDYDLEDGVLGREINFVMELRDERAKFLKESDANGLQIGLAFAGYLIAG